MEIKSSENEAGISENDDNSADEDGEKGNLDWEQRGLQLPAYKSPENCRNPGNDPPLPQFSKLHPWEVGRV